MAHSTFSIHTDYIDLLQFLKATGIAATGGEAKALVDEGLVRVDGESEHRRRRKLRPGNRIEIHTTDLEVWTIVATLDPR